MKNSKFALIAAATIAAALTSGAFAAQQPVAPATGTAIKVFDQPNFKGNVLMFDRSIASLAALNFNDRAASVKIDGSRDWVLCEHRNFMGKCVRVHLKEKDLKRLKFEGKVSSLYPVPAPVQTR